MRGNSCLLLVAAGLFAQPLPKFEDYPAGELFKGRPAPPKLMDDGARLFRTRIREGAAKGPKFAGKFAVARWGCGSGCVSMALVNSVDGSVHWAPFGILAVPGDQEALSFRLDSRLLIVRGCPEDNLSACGSFFYEWTGKAFKLVRKIPAKKSTEP